MTDTYADYEKSCNAIRAENEQLLQDFEKAMDSKGLSEKVINNHIANVDFYINEFLLYEDAVRASDGAYKIGTFLGYWFIKKAMWSSPGNVRSSAASLKKFYSFMLDQGLISKETYSCLCQTIKEEMAEWLATMERYEDESITDMNKVWGL